MGFFELDQKIRAVLPDGKDRRDILSALHDLEEGANQCHAYFLKSLGYVYDDTTQSWHKADSTPFQVQ